MIGILFLIGHHGYAQDTTHLWSLADCLAYAKEHNISIRQADINIKEAKLNNLYAKGQLFPSLSGSVSQNYNIGLSVDPITNLKKDETTKSNGFGLNAQWNLFNGFRVLNNIRKSTFDAIASKYQKEKMENDLTINIVNAYLQILLNKELLDLANNQLKLSRKQESEMSEQVKVGEKATSDLVDVQSQVASDVQQAVQSENSLVQARLLLAQYLQLKDTNQLKISTDTTFLADTAMLSKTLEQVYENALSTQPGVKMQQAMVNSAERSFQMTKGNFLPSLSFSAGAGTDYSDQYIINNVKVPFSKQFNDNLGYYFSFNLNIPIFQNFYAYTTYRTAKLEVAKAKEQASLEAYTLWQAIQSVYSNTRLSIRGYEAGSQSYDAQKKAYDFAGERYKSGLITSYDYELARNKMMTAASQMVQYKYEYWYNLLLLQFYFTNKIE